MTDAEHLSVCDHTTVRGTLPIAVLFDTYQQYQIDVRMYAHIYIMRYSSTYLRR